MKEELMTTQDWVNEQKIEVVQDRKDGKDYWRTDNLYTEADLIELLEAFAEALQKAKEEQPKDVEEFLKACKEVRKDFAETVSTYHVEHNKVLRTKTDTLLIMFDQLTNFANSRKEWISIEDRLPELENRYLVVREGCVGIEKFIIDKEKAYWYNYFKITHWMPLPSVEQLNK